MSHHYFYDQPIDPDTEQKKIEQILKEYQSREVNEELLQEVYEKLMLKRHQGEISIPFSLAIKKGSNESSSYIEVELDTKL